LLVGLGKAEAGDSEALLESTTFIRGHMVGVLFPLPINGFFFKVEPVVIITKYCSWMKKNRNNYHNENSYLINLI
jgi:hypothetical protein